MDPHRPASSECSSAASLWIPGVLEHLRAADTGVLVVDHTADTKYSLSGAGLHDWLDSVAPAWPWLGGALRTYVARRSLKGVQDRLEAIVRSLGRGTDRCLFCAPPDHKPQVTAWLGLRAPRASVTVRDDTARYACLELYGPKRARLIEALSAAGKDRTRILVREDRYNASTLLTLPARVASSVMSRLQAMDPEITVTTGGDFAEEALRIKRGRPKFGHEILSLPGALTLGALTLGAFSSPLPTLGFGGGDPILAGERQIGVITSRLRLPGWETTLMLGRVDFAAWRGESLEMFAEGQRWPLAARETQWEIDMRTGTHDLGARPFTAER